MNKKIRLMILLLFAIIFSISAVNAVENITVDSDSSIEGEVEMPTERLDVLFNDEKQILSFRITDERLSTGLTNSISYTYYVDNEMVAAGSKIYGNEKTSNYYSYNYKDGEHNLIIKKDYFDSSPLFNVTFNIKNNIALSNDITIQHTKTVKYSIVNGVIPSESGNYDWTTLKDGWNNLSEYSLLGSGLGSTKPIILKVYYRGYVVGGVDITNKTTLSVSGSTFYINGYKSYNSWGYNQNEIKLLGQVSWDGLYNYQYKSSITTPVTVKEPIYSWKKVKNGYKWKYYKTKWHKTKIVTHKWKKGKFIVYHNKLRKVKKLLRQNGKLIKTVYRRKKTTVYIKYPVDYYKKVKKYKTISVITGYDNVVKNQVTDIWVDAKGTPEQISYR